MSEILNDNYIVRFISYENNVLFDCANPYNSQRYFYLICDEFEDGATLSRICIESYSMDIENAIDVETQSEGLAIENALLKKEIAELREEVEKFKLRFTTNSYHQRIKYRTQEDDGFFYIISEEKENTVTFSRAFDRTTANYNWINPGDLLITIKFDDYDLMSYQSKVECPVYGVFEFDKKKFIRFEEVICRVRKYAPEQKEALFEEFEKQAIKEAVYKKEKKKRFEQEAFKELMEDGLIFTYIDKNGKREPIPQDVMNHVWNRDGGKCITCGSKENLEFDHIVPVSKGGSTTYRNLQLLCKTCNIKKYNKI